MSDVLIILKCDDTGRTKKRFSDNLLLKNMAKNTFILLKPVMVRERGHQDLEMSKILKVSPILFIAVWTVY